MPLKRRMLAANERRRAQMPGLRADAAGVLGEATVTDIVGAILDVPVVTDGFGTLSGWQHDVADKQGGLGGIAP